MVRAQSKYGLMGSSAKTGKKFFHRSQEQFLDKTVIWDRTPPPAIHQIQCICVGEGPRVPNLQTEFNYLDLFKSYGIFSDFVVHVVPMLSLLSPCHPRHSHIIPVSSPLSPHHPRHPHVIPIAPRRSPCGPHGCGLRGLCCLHPMLSPRSLWSPRHLVIPTLSPSSPHHPHSPQKVSMWSPWLWSPWSPLSPPHVVP